MVLHSNVRGFNSKKEFLKEVLNDLNDVDLCILNETGLRGRNKVTLPGYLSYTRNRVVKSMGGISTSVKDTIKDSTVKVTEGIENDEFLIIRLEQFSPAI